MRLKDLISAPMNLVAPPVCQLCGRKTEGGPVCSTCIAKIEELRLPVCCYRPLDDSRIKRIFVPYRFDSLVASVVHLFKYQGNMEMGKFMADAMAQMIEGTSFDIITDIPLFAARQRERGFSQTELLTEWIAAKTGLVYRKLLRRKRYTRPQARLKDHQARIKNVAEAFGLTVSADVVAQKAILIVDDVTTSGATLNEAAVPLIEAGAKSVSALVFAVAG